MVWEETQIKEETEDGSAVESKISLPVYSSSYVNTILFSLSTELYRIGCHGFSDGEVPLMLGAYRGLCQWVSYNYLALYLGA